MKVIIVTGTPGTGKTTFAKKFAKEKKYKYIDVNDVIEKNKLKERYDRKRKTYIVDEKKLSRILEKAIKDASKEGKDKGLVIDSHLSHYINPKYVDLCIVTKCNLKELARRLKKKGYSKNKIDENLQCEIFDVCLIDAKERGHRIKIVQTDRK
ncbi:MAG: AAA family ATPase [Candidatus Woesearchaeota archaeon]|nr:AAA family ATPase [Candidatus Woesearchaeota archaeon]